MRVGIRPNPNPNPNPNTNPNTNPNPNPTPNPNPNPTQVGFVFSEVQTTGDEAGYRNALEQTMGTHAFNELALTIDR